MLINHILCEYSIIYYIYKKYIVMKIHEKVKDVRENRKLSQEFIAHKLGLDQSQYSRRESGEIKFLAEEIILLSKALDTKISELYNEESTVFNNLDQKGGASGQYVTIVSDKLIEQFEKRIIEKDTIIEELKKEIKKNSKT